MEESNVLKPHLGVFQGAAMIMGCMFGSGIFMNPLEIFKELKTPWMALFAWTLGAIIAFSGSMCYAELCSRFKSSGSDAPFLSNAYRKPKELLAYLFSWCRVFFINPGLASSVSITCSNYILKMFLDTRDECVNLDSAKMIQILSCRWPNVLIEWTILTLFTIIICYSSEISTKCCSALVYVATSVVIIMAVTGIYGIFSAGTGLENFNKPFYESISPTGWSKGFTFIMWAYDGWSNLASVSGEISNPESVIPKASLLGILTVSITYLIINVGLIGVVPWKDITTDEINIVWAKKIFPSNESHASILVSAFVVICTLSCCFMTVFSSSRIGQATGLEKRVLFPDFFAKVHKKLQTPVNAALINWALTCIMVAVLEIMMQGTAYTTVVDMVAYQFWFFCGLSCLGLLIMRYRNDQSCSFKVPLFFPILLVCCIFTYLVAQIFGDSIWSVLIAIFVILLGIIPYFLCFDPNDVPEFRQEVLT